MVFKHYSRSAWPNLWVESRLAFYGAFSVLRVHFSGENRSNPPSAGSPIISIRQERAITWANIPIDIAMIGPAIVAVAIVAVEQLHQITLSEDTQ